MNQKKTPLSIAFPELVSEWNIDKNNGSKLDDYTAGSNKKVWWKCKKGHEYECAIDHRTLRKQGCPYCSGKRVCTGFNDLKTRDPFLAREWNYDKNGDCLPDSVALNSHSKYWWKCEICHFEWMASPNDRARGRGCPKCGKKKRKESRAKTILFRRDENNLTRHKELLSEWDYSLNEREPKYYLSGSTTKVWWKCEVCGNTWQATINNRVNGSGCPKCMKHMQTSFPEQAILYYLRKCFTYVFNGSFDFLDGKTELDIYIPEITTAIEYDGVAFHTGERATKKMIEKYKMCKEREIRLIRVSEFKNESDSYDQCLVREGNTEESLNNVIKKLLDDLNIHGLSIDVQHDRSSIMRQYITSLREKSINARYPGSAAKWDVEKNGGLKPDQVSAFSNKKYWWKCQMGHSYQSTPANEVTFIKNCPICSNHQVLEGFNDLSSRSPQLTLEWDYKKNYPLKPTQIVFSSSRKVWWLCPNKHSYEATAESRLKKGTGCPYCSNKKVLPGYNDLKTKNPELLREWNYKRNANIRPEDLLPGSNRKVWWICKNGHEWEVVVNSRSGKGHAECPFCSGHKVLNGYNDLATKYPELLLEWDYNRNIDINPNCISPGSNLQVWWKCRTCSNEWKARIVNRVYGIKTGCPKCGYIIKMKKTRAENIKKEKRDFCTRFPEIAREWDYEKNEVNPTEILPAANLKIWWKCEKGHSYQSWLSDRTGKHKTGCPYCKGKRKLPKDYSC